MGSRSKKRFIFPKPPPPRVVPWHEKGLVWGSVGFATCLFAIGCGLNSHPTVAHVAFASSALFGAVAVWYASSEIKPKARRLTVIGGWATFLSSLVYCSDNVLIDKPRAHLRKTGIILREFGPNKKTKISLGVRNDGTLPTTEVAIFESISVANLYEPGSEQDRGLEDMLFGLTLNQNNPLTKEVLREHSDTYTIPIVDSEAMDDDTVRAVLDGSKALYVAGKLIYKDKNGTRETSFCGMWQKDITLGTEMDFCRNHNDEP